MCLLGTVACFDPTLPAVACGEGSSCPDGLECNEVTNSCEPPGGTDDASSTIDAPIASVDASTPTVDAVPPADVIPIDCSGWTSLYFDTCALPMASDLNFTTGVWTINTSSQTVTDPLGSAFTPASLVISQDGGVEAWLITASDITVDADASVRVIGARPLIMASTDDIDVLGLIDVSAGGAGSEPSICSATAPQPGQAEGSGSGAGGGGAFNGDGGDGSGGESPGTGGAGGTSVALPDSIRGGCAGAMGGDTEGGPGGLGGGALLLAARNSVVVSGVLSAGGQGGRGALADSAGGGGGGSGGLLVLESMAVNVPGVMVANGGGGGAGSNGNMSALDGEDGRLATSRAEGGAGQGAGGTGGDGGTAQLNGLDGLMDDDGGGGGGGGAGFNVVRASTWSVAGTVSPFALVNP
jgi:hypothetical protein